MIARNLVRILCSIVMYYNSIAFVCAGSETSGTTVSTEDTEDNSILLEEDINCEIPSTNDTTFDDYLESMQASYQKDRQDLDSRTLNTEEEVDSKSLLNMENNVLFKSEEQKIQEEGDSSRSAEEMVTMLDFFIGEGRDNILGGENIDPRMKAKRELEKTDPDAAAKIKIDSNPWIEFQKFAGGTNLPLFRTVLLLQVVNTLYTVWSVFAKKSFDRRNARADAGKKLNIKRLRRVHKLGLILTIIAVTTTIISITKHQTHYDRKIDNAVRCLKNKLKDTETKSQIYFLNEIWEQQKGYYESYTDLKIIFEICLLLYIAALFVTIYEASTFLSQNFSDANFANMGKDNLQHLTKVNKADIWSITGRLIFLVTSVVLIIVQIILIEHNLIKGLHERKTVGKQLCLVVEDDNNDRCCTFESDAEKALALVTSSDSEGQAGVLSGNPLSPYTSPDKLFPDLNRAKECCKFNSVDNAVSITDGKITVQERCNFYPPYVKFIQDLGAPPE
ncbi:hypothetical protein OAB57_01400 [Bacteriovoracaceae bacterium]|nr:hypothetical protein [Bacteriovoracaceae bacterium]